MKKRLPATGAERLTTGLLWVFLLGFGWVNLLDGGISLRGKSGQIVYAGGNTDLAVAAGTFLLAVLVTLLLARALALSRLASWLMLLAILVPPLLFVLFNPAG